MATRLLNVYKHILIYRRQNLRSLSHLFRCLSNHKGDGEMMEQQNSSKVNPELEPVSRWLNIRAGILGPEDERLPFPGDIGLDSDLSVSVQSSAIKNRKKFDVLQLPKREIGPEDIDHFFTHQEQQIMQMHYLKEAYLKVIEFEDSDIGGVIQLECRIQKCPDLLKKDFAMLFPEENIANHDLTVLTLCQKTQNDMSGWSEDSENEREELISQFSERAQKVCGVLMEEGYWADFIDPSSGRPSIGSFTNSTLFETDERFRHFGFTIEDLGCCKVISHRAWGKHIFVGAIFTNAPMYSDAVEDAINGISVKSKS